MYHHLESASVVATDLCLCADEEKGTCHRYYNIGMAM
jgi:hypothetical protein